MLFFDKRQELSECYWKEQMEAAHYETVDYIYMSLHYSCWIFSFSFLMICFLWMDVLWDIFRKQESLCPPSRLPREVCLTGGRAVENDLAAFGKMSEISHRSYKWRVHEQNNWVSYPEVSISLIIHPKYRTIGRVYLCGHFESSDHRFSSPRLRQEW